MKRLLLLAGPTLGVLLIFILVTQALIRMEAKPHIYSDIRAIPQAQTVIIPGAAVLSDRTLSPIFRDRVDAAIVLYVAGKVSKILVSGGNSTVENNEVNPVLNYLLAQDIPRQDIFLDHAGFDTYSTMYRAKHIFQVDSAIIATQSFHLPRGVFIARQLGITAYGLKADDNDRPLRFRNHVREFFAKEKAALDLILNRKPRYLGEQIPITGDGGNHP